jgi:putative ABC transport system permease protein
MLLQDIRYALRRLKNDPGFAAVAVLTLALGIGANSAIFSIVNAVLLRPLPYQDPEKLVLLSEQLPTFPRLSVTYLNYKDIRDQSHSYEAMGAVRNTFSNMTGVAEPERLPAQMVTANLFSILGVKPEVGRTFSADEDKAGASGVVMISHALWQRRFSGARDVVGQAITLDNRSYSVIGVMPDRFEILQQGADVIFPFEPWASNLPNDRAWHPGILPIARLKEGVTLDQARAEMAVITKRLADQYPESNSTVVALVNSMQAQLVENVRTALLVLMGAVGFVLIIACANVASLLLARATTRQREMAVRTAIGASRSRIIRQLLTESVLLALAGGLVGLALAWMAMPPLIKLAGSSLPSTNVSIDFSVLGFTLLMAVIGGMLFGLAPARHAWRVDLRDALSETSRGSTGRGVLHARSLLVVAEIALAMLLLAGAGLLLRSFDRLSNVAPGFTTDHILIGDLLLSPVAYKDSAVRMNFFDRVLEQTAALPGVRSAGAASFLPVSGRGSALHFNIQGRPPASPRDFTIANYRTVSPGYFKTLEIPLISGRFIDERDREDAPDVCVINASMAKTYFPNQSPLGQHLQVGATPDKDIPWMEIVGIVGDVKQALASEAPTEIYFPTRQGNKIPVLPVFGLSVVVRTAGDPMAMANALRGVVRSIDANQPIVKMRTMDQNISDSIAQPRFRTVLLAIFAGLALSLAAVGIFSVMAYSVTQRTRELGVRMALGASRGRVLQLVLGHGMRLTLLGVVLGGVGTFAVSRYIQSLLFNVSPHDPATLPAVAAGLVVVSMIACYLPARRATQVDPMVALRQD